LHEQPAAAGAWRARFDDHGATLAEQLSAAPEERNAVPADPNVPIHQQHMAEAAAAPAGREYVLALGIDSPAAGQPYGLRRDVDSQRRHTGGIQRLHHAS
jgi:hypothetical protein